MLIYLHSLNQLKIVLHATVLFEAKNDNYFTHFYKNVDTDT